LYGVEAAIVESIFNRNRANAYAPGSIIGSLIVGRIAVRPYQNEGFLDSNG
jgi:hypothetical protein